MPGGDLANVLKKYGVLLEGQTKFIFYQLGLAVQYLHERTIIHRDIKSFHHPAVTLAKPSVEGPKLSKGAQRNPRKVESLFLTCLCPKSTQRTFCCTDAGISDATVKLADFGVSKIELFESGSKTFVGTKSYMAPEILMNPGASYSNKVDIWSLGILLHECQAGGPVKEGNWSTSWLITEHPRLGVTLPVLGLRGLGRWFIGTSLGGCREPVSLTGGRPIFYQSSIGENNLVVPDFTARMLSLDPEERMDIQEMLAEPWFEDEDLKERVQTSLSQHTRGRYLNVPREPRECGNNEFYFVSPQLSSISVQDDYSGLGSSYCGEEYALDTSPLEKGHSQHSDGSYTDEGSDDTHHDEDCIHSENDDGDEDSDINYTSEETDDRSVISEDCSGSSSSNDSSSGSSSSNDSRSSSSDEAISDGDDSDDSMTSDSDSSSDASGSYNLQDIEKDNVHSATDSFRDSSEFV
ncbi:unnamed protein product [Timema podura]|uniref:Protein kinase domain-containing protein n=1 Tax=Timema podura TaxID=61482 RepID=A0ABN7NII1_TIMPD|nr:unnamed protein product [Timema podura]